MQRPPTSASPSSSARLHHPVADNLLRLAAPVEPLENSDQLAGRLRSLIDLAREGRALPDEPSSEFAPRHRSLQDYVAAAAGVMDPERLALAYAFAPDEWRGDASLDGPGTCWPMRTANWYMLYAAHGGRHEISEAELLAQALAAWDQPGMAREQLQLANAKAFSLTGFGVCTTRLMNAAGQELARVLNRYVDSMGATLGLGELLFLDQIQRLQWVPRPNLSRFGTLTGSFPHIRQITEFLNKSQAVLELNAFMDEGLREVSVRSELVSAAAQCRLACQSLSDKEVLQPSPEVLQELNTRYAMFGLILALRNRAWQQAEQLVQGLSLERLRVEPDETLHQSLGFGIRAIPLISGHFREANPQILSTLEGLREVFPRVGPLIQEFVEAIRSSPAHPAQSGAAQAKPVILNAPAPAETTAPTEEAELIPLELYTELDAKLTPRIKEPTKPKAQPGIMVAALGWDKEGESTSLLEPRKDEEVLRDVTVIHGPDSSVIDLPVLAKFEEAPAMELIRPRLDQHGKPIKQRRTNSFKVVSAPPEVPNEPRRTPRIGDQDNTGTATPKRRILARLAPEENPPETPALNDPAQKKDVAAGDTLRGRPIPTPPPDVKVLPGTALHLTPRLHGYTSKQTRREKDFDKIPGHLTPLVPAAPRGEKQEDPVPAELAKESAVQEPLAAPGGDKPQAGKRLRGKREAQLPGSAPGTAAPARPSLKRKLFANLDDRTRMMLVMSSRVLLLCFFLVGSGMAFLHGPTVLRKLVPGLAPTVQKSSYKPELVKKLNAELNVAAEDVASVPADLLKPSHVDRPEVRREEIQAAQAAPAVVTPKVEIKRVAKELLGPIEPLKNFWQGQNSPFTQPAEVQVMSGDLGATGEPLARKPLDQMSTTEMLRLMSLTDNSWSFEEAHRTITGREAAPVTAIAQPDPDAKSAPTASKPAAKIARTSPPSRNAAALALFDEPEDSEIARDDMAAISDEEPIFEPVREEAKPPAQTKSNSRKSVAGSSDNKLKVKEIVYYALGGANDVKAAMINDWVYEEGEELVDFSTGDRRSFRVVSIQPEQVILKGDGGEVRLPYSKRAL